MNSSNDLPRITILTPSYNQGEYLERNIVSVLEQNYPNVEHIVIDGGSTDSTVAVLRRYPHLKWVSEKDGGQADALNKGLAMATGDIIGWVNSDDYFEPNVFHDVVAEFAQTDAQWVIGNITICYDSGLEWTERSPVITRESLIRSADIVRQQGTFFRKSAIEKAGGWDANLHFVMDFDLWMRLARVGAPRMVNKNWGYFFIHHEQKTTWRNLHRQSLEIDRVLKRQGASLTSRARVLLRKHRAVLRCALKAALIASGVVNKKYENRPFRIPQAVDGAE